MVFIFGMEINIEVFYKLILSNWMCVTRHALCIISRREWGNEVDFLPADKQKTFLQVYSITVGVHSQACPKFPKQQVCNIFTISQGKREA